MKSIKKNEVTPEQVEDYFVAMGFYSRPKPPTKKSLTKDED